MWLGNTGYENTSFSYIAKRDQTYRVILLSIVWGTSTIVALPAQVAAAVFPTVALAALTQRATSGQGTARSFSAALSVRRKSLNFKLFNSFYFKSRAFLLTNIFIRVFSLIKVNQSR